MDGPIRHVTVLGATGSIGASTLDVIERNSRAFSVTALAAHRQWEALLAEILRFRPAYAALLDLDAARELERAVKREGLPTRVLGGAEGVCEVASLAAADTVVAGIV